jgi:hypothetical protein
MLRFALGGRLPAAPLLRLAPAPWRQAFARVTSGLVLGALSDGQPPRPPRWGGPPGFRLPCRCDPLRLARRRRVVKASRG